MHVFVVRPFGIKSGIDFDKVHRELIAPALARLGLQGDTTEPIARAGNIRADMFELLAKADIVIADISIHNANVFYELGARHALRDKRTFLIRSQSDDVPFDLRTDRYLEYDKDDPGASVDKLVTGLRQTIDGPAIDSPIFQLVPKLEPQDWTRLVVVPAGFREEVEKAALGRHLGDLELLSLEARAFDWASEGLRLVGRAQFNLKAWEGARDTWEAVREHLEGDLEADLKLATVYQRLGDLAASDIALRRALADPDITDWQRAEAYSLLGSNEKTRWLGAWKDASDDEGERALGSRYLQQAQEYYAEGFASDLNHYYAGINALALQTVVAELAKAHPDIWVIDFDSADEAERALNKVERERRQLEGAVALSVERERRRLERLGNKDRWSEITPADLGLLTATNPQRAVRQYRKALEGAEDFYFDAVRRQLGLYRDLGVLADNVTAVLAELDRLEQQAGIIHARPQQDTAPPHVLLFTGHRVDAPGRAEPRFPAAKEHVARAAIKDAVAREQERVGAGLTGIAGGASGGDVLFHEVCAELGIETRLYLAIPPAQYIVESVEVPGQPEWIDRFRAVESRCRTRLLSQSKELPKWLRGRQDYGIWQRNNLWMLHNALAFGGKNVTLIALWNGKAGDGPGGTKDMVDQARARGAKVIVLDTNALFEL